MSKYGEASLSARALERLRRPEDMVEATRWLFALLTIVSLAFGLLAPLTAGNRALEVGALASTTLLAGSVLATYFRRTAPLSMDLVDALAVLVLALASPSPTTAFSFIFAALWFRSLYGSSGRAILRCALYAAGISASVPLWTHVTEHTSELAAGPVIGVIPTMFLTVIVGRHLAGSLRAREQATKRDAVHMSVGTALLGMRDAGEIRRIAWVAIAGICAATPGLRVLKVETVGAELRVGEATGGFVGVPATLPPAVLSMLGDTDGPGAESARGRADLDAAVGTHCTWTCIPLPMVHDQPTGAWLLLGAPRHLPMEAVASIRSLANQVTLALRTGEAHRELTVQASLDNLTGLANRGSFHAALVTALDDGSDPLTTVLFVDLDDFKDVNDQLGHGAGDQLLRETAARLRQATRPGDLCARLGGDEFAVLLRGTDTDTAAAVAARIVAAVSAPAHLERGVMSIGASIGVATGSSAADLEQLIHRADVAMYAAKANGKAQVKVFEAGLLGGDSSQATFVRQLANAATNGELVIHYQPVLSLPDGSCDAVEALVRWQHPEQGLLYPDRFIEIAERSGAIHDLGAHVLRRACTDVMSWRTAHPGCALAVHVNVSAVQLDDARFFTIVAECLRDLALPPDQLVLEITESVVISSKAAIDQLNALSAHGVTIAIDDFGTGYSALTTLRSLPVQIVKIDKSFVAGSTVNAEDRAVTEAVVKMAAQMGMRTIAEGVERLDQQRFLESIGTDAVQGFLYLRPTTAAEFGTWLTKHIAGQPQSRPAVVIPLVPRHTA